VNIQKFANSQVKNFGNLTVTKQFIISRTYY